MFLRWIVTPTHYIPQQQEYQATVNIGFFKLSKTCWIPLHMSNQWLFVTPQIETFNVICPQKTTSLTLLKEGKLTLKPACKGYSSYITLYAISALTTNSTDDYVPCAPINFNCCFEDIEKVNFKDLPVHVPLVNIMYNVDELRVVSMRAEEVQQMVKDQS
jgi:hypothetical protein